MTDMHTQPGITLPWQPCECGCKSSTLMIGRLEFSIQHRGAMITLSEGHVPARPISTFTKVTEVNTFLVRQPDVSRVIAQMRNLLAHIDTPPKMTA